MKYVAPTLGIIVLACLIAYCGDYLSWRFQIPHRAARGSVEIQRYYAVTLKSKKTSYMFDEPAPEECVNALFPHAGEAPCWYLHRHQRQEIEIDPAHKDDFWKAP